MSESHPLTAPAPSIVTLAKEGAVMSKAHASTPASPSTVTLIEEGAVMNPTTSTPAVPAAPPVVTPAPAQPPAAKRVKRTGGKRPRKEQIALAAMAADDLHASPARYAELGPKAPPVAELEAALRACVMACQACGGTGNVFNALFVASPCDGCKSARDALGDEIGF